MASRSASERSTSRKNSLAIYRVPRRFLDGPILGLRLWHGGDLLGRAGAPGTVNVLCQRGSFSRNHRLRAACGSRPGPKQMNRPLTFLAHYPLRWAKGGKSFDGLAGLLERGTASTPEPGGRHARLRATLPRRHSCWRV